ncbi:hypothetical protein FT673_23665 [Aeromonas hydrophila]|nr:hypothetical protein FT673_23665 [Aeromonas hydrophila]
MRDQQRDIHIEQVTGLKPIRVRHEEQEVWAAICRIEQEIISVEEYLQRLLKLMVWRRGKSTSTSLESLPSLVIPVMQPDICSIRCSHYAT